MNFRSENKSQAILGLLLVLIGITMRLLPHPANFAPVTAIALFSGVVLSPAIALTLPLIVMVSSDLIIGPHSLYWLTWSSFFLTSLLGWAVRNNAKVGTIFISTIAGSVIFFVATNLGVFLFQDMYSKDWQGFWTCYAMAIPFFRNTLLGDLFYSAVFFGVFALVKLSSPQFLSGDQVDSR